jgi:hypothetical protein
MEQANKHKCDRKTLYLILGFSTIELLLHLYTNAFAGYGYFRDELYYIACTKHIAWGYVDQPPLSIFILILNRTILSDSIFALRLLPAVASALTVFFTGKIITELNGRNVAIIAGCTALILSPIFLAMSAFFSMNSFDWLLWTLAFYLVVRLVNTEDARLWIWLGIVVGFGLLNKIDFLWFSVGLFVGIMFTPQRKYFLTKYPYIAGAIALLLFSPFIIWNVTHNWVHLEFIRNATLKKYSVITRTDFITGQILLNGPVSLPIWVSGIYFLMLHKDGKRFRLVSYIFICTFLILFINSHSKPEYLGVTTPMLFAAGGIMVEKLSKLSWARWTTIAVPLCLFFGGIFLIPLALPILPVNTFIGYSRLLGLRQPAEEKEISYPAELPQFYADMFGWQNMAKSVSKVYKSLSPEEKQKAKIFAQNYGEAGAIQFYTNKYPLPPVICPHNSFWYWGYGDTTRNIIIAIGGTKEKYLRFFSSVVEFGIIRSNYAISYETNLRIFVCKGLKEPINKMWDKVRLIM